MSSAAAAAPRCLLPLAAAAALSPRPSGASSGPANTSHTRARTSAAGRPAQAVGKCRCRWRRWRRAARGCPRTCDRGPGSAARAYMMTTMTGRPMLLLLPLLDCVGLADRERRFAVNRATLCQYASGPTPPELFISRPRSARSRRRLFIPLLLLLRPGARDSYGRALPIACFFLSAAASKNNSRIPRESPGAYVRTPLRARCSGSNLLYLLIFLVLYLPLPFPLSQTRLRRISERLPPKRTARRLKKVPRMRG